MASGKKQPKDQLGVPVPPGPKNLAAPARKPRKSARVRKKGTGVPKPPRMAIKVKKA